LPNMVGQFRYERSEDNRTARVNISQANLTGLNVARIVAVDTDGTMIGGSFNAATGIFTLTSDRVIGQFTVTYLENLLRLSVAIGGFVINDLIANEVAVQMDVPAIIVDDRTLLPVRFVADALGAVTDWNEGDRQVTLRMGTQEVTLLLDVDHPAIGLDVPAQIIDDRTYVPLRFISEFFGANVTWNEATRVVGITLY